MKIYIYLAVFIKTVISDCGIVPAYPVLRITNGAKAAPYSWPWQAAVRRESLLGYTLCGGSVIAESWILTAAHCTYGYSDLPFIFNIRVGVQQQDSLKPEPGEVIAQVEGIYIHPNYDPQTAKYDISLLKLRSPLKFTRHIQPVCLPAYDSDVINDPSNYATITGWGTTSQGGAISQDLYQAKVPFVPQILCLVSYLGIASVDPAASICAGGTGTDTCNGDSGGPLVFNPYGKWYQYGVTSFGTQICGDLNHPGVYTRVSACCDFLRETTNQELCSMPSRSATVINGTNYYFPENKAAFLLPSVVSILVCIFLSIR